MGFLSVVDKVVGVVDKFVPDTDKANELKAEIENALIDAQAQMEVELTKRHATDMSSDSWLSKNIRPLILVFLTVSTIALIYLTIFILDESKVALIQPWQGLLTVLLTTAYAFYFGSRGIEKVQSIKKK